MKAAIKIGKAKKSGPVCESVYGVVEGDTCFEVANAFGLSTEAFDSLNPNLNCTNLFVAQWLCVAGAAK